MAGGRPTKYSKDLQKKAEHYLKNYEEYGDVVPSVVGLSLALNISDKTIQDWAKHKTKVMFSRTLEKIRAKQHVVALSKGLTGEFKSPIAKLLLHNHGYSDKVENDQKGDIAITVRYKE